MRENQVALLKYFNKIRGYYVQDSRSGNAREYLLYGSRSTASSTALPPGQFVIVKQMKRKNF